MRIEHAQCRECVDCETDRPFTYSIKDILSTSYKDDKFTIFGEYFS